MKNNHADLLCRIGETQRDETNTARRRAIGAAQKDGCNQRYTFTAAFGLLAAQDSMGQLFSIDQNLYLWLFVVVCIAIGLGTMISSGGGFSTDKKSGTGYSDSLGYDDDDGGDFGFSDDD